MSKAGRNTRIENKRFRAVVDRRTGMLAEFCMFGSEHGQWNDVVDGRLVYENRAGLRVRDERSDTIYSDPFGLGHVFYHEPRKLVDRGKGSRPRCDSFQARSDKGLKRLSFRKTYRGAPFDIRTELTVKPDAIRWDNVLALKPGAEQRSVQLEYALPIFRSVNGGHYPRGWQVWTALEDAPFAFGHVGGWGHSQASWYVHKFPYCSVNAGAGIGLPLMDIFNTAYDFGLALIAPLDLVKTELVFAVDKENSELRLAYHNLGLRPGTKSATSLLLVPHRGDWRVALNWLHKRHRSYFTPNNPKIVEQEGTMYYGMPTSERTVKSWVKTMGLKWTEILYNPSFGDYVPAAQVWDFDMLCTPKHPERIIRGISKDDVRCYLRVLKRHGVASFVYYNYGECDRARALREFPECVLHNDHGIQGAWVFPDRKRSNVLMNPDPASRWGKFILRQADELFDTYRDLDGFFIDQVCYHNYDYARDDGRSLVENRPVYDTHAASCRMMARVARILKRRDKTCFINGPYNIEVMRDADGVMSEGSVAGLAKYSYMCLEKPVMILTYGVEGPAFERVLKYCLKYGAFPSTPWHHANAFNPPLRPAPGMLALYRKYLPLLETLRGRKWVLASNPVSFPTGLDGNIFEARNGGYVLPFFATEKLTIDRSAVAAQQRVVSVRVPGAARIRSAQWQSVDFTGTRRLPVRQSKRGMHITIPRPSTASVLLF